MTTRRRRRQGGGDNEEETRRRRQGGGGDKEEDGDDDASMIYHEQRHRTLTGFGFLNVRSWRTMLKRSSFNNSCAATTLAEVPIGTSPQTRIPNGTNEGLGSGV